MIYRVTGAGPRVTRAFANNLEPPQQFMDAVDEVVRDCKARGARILIDAESQRFQTGIMLIGLDLMRKYNKDGYAVVYTTYQAYLKSTPFFLASHLASALDDSFTLGLKVVRGAYLATDERRLIHDTKKETDEAYDGIASGALQQRLFGFGGDDGRPFPSVNLLLATHNKSSAEKAQRLHQQRPKEMLPTVPVSFAQLHGMSDQVSFGLLASNQSGSTGLDVYKCSTWGTMAECMGYLSRRVLENRDAASRTTDEYKALKSELWRRLRMAGRH